MRGFIETRGTRWAREVDEESRRGRYQRFLVQYGFPIVQDWSPRGETVAYVNEGRWVAECPEEWCRGAEMVDPEWPVFVCASGCGAGPFAVVFPRGREAIEAELVKRPAPVTRNWLPGETAADLRRENRERGVPRKSEG